MQRPAHLLRMLDRSPSRLPIFSSRTHVSLRGRPRALDDRRLSGDERSTVTGAATPVEFDAHDIGDAVDVGVECEERNAVPVGDRRDHAVDQTARGHAFLAAGAVDARRGIEVDSRVEAQEVEAQQEPTQVMFALIAAAAPATTSMITARSRQLRRRRR